MKHQFKDQNSKATLVEATEELQTEVTADDVNEKEPEVKSIFKKAKISGANMVNMRAEPNGPVIAILNNGTDIEAKNNGEWSEVSVGNKTGYVMSKYIQ